MKKCKVCGALTDTVFNIKLKATPICEDCASSIFLQQATWYTQQSFNNLNLHNITLQLPPFLYEDEGQIKIGFDGDAVVTEEWNQWKEFNLQ